MPFHCVIVTPEQQAADESCSQVILPAHDGEIGVLTDRAPLLVKLGVGVLRMDLAAGGQRRRFFIDGGIAQMKDNQLTVLTNEALDPERIDVEAARAATAEASARVATDEKSRQDREHALQRGRAMQQVASERR